MITPLKSIWVIACVTVLVGCKKSPQANANSGTASPPPAAVAVSGTTIDPVEFKSAMAAAEAAIKQKEFETAAKSLVGIQMSGAQMTPQEADAYTANMRRLQTSLADAPANDPRAEATRALLRNTGRGPAPR